MYMRYILIIYTRSFISSDSKHVPSNLILYMGMFMLKGDKCTHLTESLQRVGSFIKSDVFKYD
jgi:hypothetical protein